MINSAARGAIWSSQKKGTPLAELEVGSSVYLNVDGVATEFIVINQGVPAGSAPVTCEYDSSCDGTWLMMNGSAGSSTYANALTLLNNTFLPKLDADIQEAIETVTIPISSSATITTKVFNLSSNEVGTNISSSNGNRGAGKSTSFFPKSNVTGSTTFTRRGMYLRGSWLRDDSSKTSFYAFAINTETSALNENYYGAMATENETTSLRVVPVIVMPYTAKIDENGVVVV